MPTFTYAFVPQQLPYHNLIMDNIYKVETNLHTISGGHISIFHNYSFCIIICYQENIYATILIYLSLHKKLETFPLCDLHNKLIKKKNYNNLDDHMIQVLNAVF